MTNGGADPRLRIGYLVHAVAPPPPPSPSRPPPLPRRGAVPRPPPAHAGLVLPPLRLRPLGGGGGGGGGRSVAATLAPRLWSPAPVLTAGVGRPAAAGGGAAVADAAAPPPAGWWCRAGPPRPAPAVSPVTILAADVAARPDGWLTAARPPRAPTAPRPPATAGGGRPHLPSVPHGGAAGAAGGPPGAVVPRAPSLPPTAAPRRAVGLVGGGAVARPAAAAVGGVGGGAPARRGRHGHGAAAVVCSWPPRAGRVAKPRVLCGRGCGRSFGNRSGTLWPSAGGEGEGTPLAAPRREVSTVRPRGASVLDRV